MTGWRLAFRSLRYYAGSSAAVAAGVALSAAVITGSLVMGDSMRGSLRAAALKRLGPVDHAILGADFFREALAAEIGAGPIGHPVPAIILEATAVRAGAASGPVAVQVVALPVSTGAADTQRRDARRAVSLTADARRAADVRQVAINQALAQALGGVQAGEALVVHLWRPPRTPVESVFGRRGREQVVLRLRVVVQEVLPEEAPMAHFSLRPDQPRPRNVFVSLPWLQRMMGLTGQVNAVLVMSGAAEAAALKAAVAQAARVEDYGLVWRDEPREGRRRLESRSLVLPEAVVKAGREAAGRLGLPLSVASVYLANRLCRLRPGSPASEIPYSVVAAVDPLPAEWPTLGPRDILLNDWAARELNAAVGDEIEMVCYARDDSGELTTAARRFTLRGVVAMSGLGADPGLTPEVEGLTDRLSMRDWDPPVPIDRSRIRDQDEAYWQRYRAAPKAFVEPAVLRRLWAAGYGGRLAEPAWVTSLRLRASPAEARRWESALVAQLAPSGLGLAVRPVREEALAAAAGSTDFAMLFLAMSGFLVASGVGLAALLLWLSVERRASQFGLLTAVGFRGEVAGGLLMREAAVAILAGALVGAPLGVAYAGLLLAGLRRGAADPAEAGLLVLYVEPASLVAGAAVAMVAAWAAARWALRGLRGAEPLPLLFGWRARLVIPSRRAGRASLIVAAVCLAAGLASLAAAIAGPLLPAVPAFFLGGTAILIGLVALLNWRLSRAGRSGTALSLWRLSGRGLALRRTRSVLTAGLMAAASFLIVSVAANRVDLSRVDTSDRRSGAGGFALAADTVLPVPERLDTAASRARAGFDSPAEEAMREARVTALRSSGGEDASCLNRQRPVAPRVLGVPGAMIARGGFAFAASAAETEDQRRNPWRLLERALPGGEVPAVGDAASVRWVLHAALGDVVEVPTGRGQPLRLRVVGLLEGSIFQSELLVSERAFVEHFGSQGGYRRFLVEAPAEAQERVAQALERGLADYGVDARSTAEMLGMYGRVQNLYMALFQVLGGLGLLVGTFGAVVVLVRNVLERRGELALLAAVGYGVGRLVTLVVAENGLNLALGLVGGAAAAVLASGPAWTSHAAAVEWTAVAAALGAILAFGWLACAVAARLSLRGDLVAALRRE